MLQDLEKLRTIFVAEEVDDEVREENLRVLREWESSLFENEALQSWLEHPITQSIVRKARASYKEIGVSLAEDRSLTQEQRMSLWSKQDAMLYFIGLASRDPKAEIAKVRASISVALKAVVETG